MADKTITIQATMDERWVDDFCSFLKYMERCGNIGHSSIVGFYSDGDGDFKPKFDINTEFKKQEGIKITKERALPPMEIMFDAG